MKLDRLLRMFTAPTEYWNEVIAEPGDIRSLLVPQMLILAAVPAVAQFLGTVMRFLVLAMRLGVSGNVIGGALVGLLLGYGLNIAAWLIMGLVVDFFAEPFGGQRDAGQSNKLAAGAVIPVWLGSVLHIIPLPGFGLLGVLAGLGYGAYLLYLGLPILNGTAEDKAVGYTAAVMGITFVIMLIFSFIMACPASCLMSAALLH